MLAKYNDILSEHFCIRLKYISMLPECIRILSKHSYTIKKHLYTFNVCSYAILHSYTF